MKSRFAIGLVLAFALPASAVAGGACGRANSRGCDLSQASVNFLAVPDISKEIVLSEPVVPLTKKVAPQDPVQNAYTGPFIGASKNENAPTIGFYWSLN